MRISAVNAQEPFSGETIRLNDDGDEEIASKVVEASRKNHAIEYKPPKAPEPKNPDVKLEKKSKANPKQSPGIPKKDNLKK
jgi:hypothetical protein